MFNICPLIDNMCPFCAKSRWNPRKNKYDNTNRIYCGITSGYDGRVEALDECWLKMSKPQRTKWKKIKKAESELIRRSRV